MQRSHKFVFVPFCTLSQGVRATGIVRKYPAIVTPVLELLIHLNINIVQMPCPELFFDGWQRQPCQKKKYDRPENRKVCQEVGGGVVKMVQMCQTNGTEVCAILGIERSPSCAVSLLTAPPPKRIINGTGIFIEELQTLMRSQGVQKVPFLGIDILAISETLSKLRELLR